MPYPGGRYSQYPSTASVVPIGLAVMRDDDDPSSLVPPLLSASDASTLDSSDVVPASVDPRAPEVGPVPSLASPEDAASELVAAPVVDAVLVVPAPVLPVAPEDSEDSPHASVVQVPSPGSLAQALAKRHDKADART